MQKKVKISEIGIAIMVFRCYIATMKFVYNFNSPGNGH